MANYRTDEDLKAAATELVNTLNIRRGDALQQIVRLRLQIALADAYHQGVMDGIEQFCETAKQRLIEAFPPQQNKEPLT